MRSADGNPGNAVSTHVSLWDLFQGFLKIGMLGFGGVAAIARHVIVEDRHWLNEKEYATILGLGKVLPGANTVNAAVMIGNRFRGRTGALVAVAAILAMPLLVLILAAVAYSHYADSPYVNAALAGAAAGAAGMTAGTGLKMITNLRPHPIGIATCIAGVLAIGVWQLPLLPVVAVLIPVALLATWLARRAA